MTALTVTAIEISFTVLYFCSLSELLLLIHKITGHLMLCRSLRTERNCL